MLTRFGLILLVAFAATPPADADSGLHVTNWSILPEDLRSVIVWHRRFVPRYPEDGKDLMEVRNWPRTRVFEGQIYSLEFTAFKLDVFKLGLKSLGDVPKGWDYGASYVLHLGDGRSQSRGPAFWWRSDGTLSERTYGGRIWEYCSRGVLHHYFFVPEGRGSGHTGLHEYFSHEGDLVGLMVDNRSYWLGREIPVHTFFQQVSEVYAACKARRT